MRDVSNHFCIIPPELMTGYLTQDECRYMPHGAIDITCSRKIVIDQSPIEDSDGRRWSISMSAASMDRCLEKMDGIRAYIGVFMTDGSIRILGTRDFIPRMIVTPYAGAFAISVSFEALKSISL